MPLACCSFDSEALRPPSSHPPTHTTHPPTHPHPLNPPTHPHCLVPESTINALKENVSHELSECRAFCFLMRSHPLATLVHPPLGARQCLELARLRITSSRNVCRCLCTCAVFFCPFFSLASTCITTRELTLHSRRTRRAWLELDDSMLAHF
jgi:hypothetical protein